MNPVEQWPHEPVNCWCDEPPESAVARMIAGLEMLLREAVEDES